MAIMCLAGTASAEAHIAPASLHCEYRENPLGIDATKPRLSWISESSQRGQKQTGYRILVASSPDILSNDVGDLWDSGKVQSDQSVHVEYGGNPLASRQACFWKIRGWDKSNIASD
jgi:alpha-L-rhamnosidase